LCLPFSARIVPSIDPPRYEPLPGLFELPAWLWRRAGRAGRIGAVLTLLALIAFGIALVPLLRDAARERDEADARLKAEQRAELAQRLEAEQRPRRHRSDAVAPPTSTPRVRLAARSRLMDEVAAAITADARARVRDRILRTECEPFPRTVHGTGVHETLARRRGRYSCVAVTSVFEGGLIGHQYRAMVDFETGRYAYCKVTAQPAPTREQLVTTPRACGG
jgi:hypothetical protein